MTDLLTRQELLRRAAFGTALVSLPGLAAACSGGDDGSGEKKLAETLKVSNWILYMDFDAKPKRRPTLEAFEKRYGTTVEYREDVNSNSQFFGKIQEQLSRGQSINRDLIVSTDNERFLGTYIDKGWVQKLDKDALPNIDNLVDIQRHPGFDPDREYSLPWASGLTGIAYNEKLTKPITSIEQLLEDKSLKGQVGLLDGFGDTLGLVMLANGDDPSKVTDDSFERAVDRVRVAQASGQLRRIYGNDYTRALAKGDLKACVAWSGDIDQLQQDNPVLKWGSPTTTGSSGPTTR